MTAQSNLHQSSPYAANPYAAPRAEVAGGPEDDEYQPVRLLAVSGRMGRIRYVVNSVGIWLLFGIAMAAVGAMMGATGMLNMTVMYVMVGLGYLGMFTLAFMMAIQRHHDMDQSGWWCLLILVPFVNAFYGLYMVFAPGTPGRNRFGAQTPPNSTFSVVIACIFPALMVIGIVAAVALPAYSDYTKRAQMQAR